MKRPMLTPAAIFAVLALAIAAGAVCWFFGVGTKHAGRAIVRVSGAIVKVEIADTPVLQTKGLSGHKPLAADEGMLFLFGSSDRRTFWMKDMLFPIDIIWIRNGRVIDITAGAPVPSGQGSLPTFSPSGPADTVLEVPAGFASSHAIISGSTISIER